MSKKTTKPKPQKRQLTVVEKRRRAELAEAKRELRIEHQITKHVKALERIIARRDLQLFNFAQTLLGPDYRIVPASSPAGHASEHDERVVG